MLNVHMNFMTMLLRFWSGHPVAPAQIRSAHVLVAAYARFFAAREAPSRLRLTPKDLTSHFCPRTHEIETDEPRSDLGLSRGRVFICSRGASCRALWCVIVPASVAWLGGRDTEAGVVVLLYYQW